MKIISIVIALIFSQTIFAKRLAPAEIKPIISKHGILERSFVRNDKGFATYVSLKTKGGIVKWKTKLFSGKYIANLETDVQDVHLKTLKLEYPYANAIDEKGKSYQIDMLNGKLIQPTKPAEY